MATTDMLHSRLAEGGAELQLDAELRLGVHDASRVEWILSLPLPSSAETDYSAEVSIEIPSNLFAKHAPWDQLQELARLDGPEDSPAFDASSIDGLRRLAVLAASKLTRAADGLARHGQVFSSTSSEDQAVAVEGLGASLRFALELVSHTRAKITKKCADDSRKTATERDLVDEYLSMRLLELLSGAERNLEALGADGHEALRGFGEALGAALEAELQYRSDRGFIEATPESRAALEAYLDRASRLKKHFQEVLFLEADRYAVVDRIHHVVAAVVAVVASTWAFAWQFALASRATSEARALSGVIALAVAAGVVYAVKDRIKEVGRAWIAGRVHRLYAQRVLTWRAPAKAGSGGKMVLSARESIDEHAVSEPDPLNPGSGTTLTRRRICFVQRGTIAPAKALVDSGITRVRQVFRYDLSPIFSRLDDAEKSVPVLDVHARRVRIARAPRCYRFPITMRVTLGATTFEERGELVVHKRGLERLEGTVPATWTPARRVSGSSTSADRASR